MNTSECPEYMLDKVIRSSLVPFIMAEHVNEKVALQVEPLEFSNGLHVKFILTLYHSLSEKTI